MPPDIASIPVQQRVVFRQPALRLIINQSHHCGSFLYEICPKTISLFAFKNQRIQIQFHQTIKIDFYSDTFIIGAAIIGFVSYL